MPTKAHFIHTATNTLSKSTIFILANKYRRSKDNNAMEEIISSLSLSLCDSFVVTYQFLQVFVPNVVWSRNNPDLCRKDLLPSIYFQKTSPPKQSSRSSLKSQRKYILSSPLKKTRQSGGVSFRRDCAAQVSTYS